MIDFFEYTFFGRFLWNHINALHNEKVKFYLKEKCLKMLNKIKQINLR